MSIKHRRCRKKHANDVNDDGLSLCEFSLLARCVGGQTEYKKHYDDDDGDDDDDDDVDDGDDGDDDDDDDDDDDG